MPMIHPERREELAILWLDQPGEKLNKISEDLLQEFQDLLDRLENDPGIRALVLISRKADNFIAGADVEKFLDMTAPGQAEALSRNGNELLSRVAAFPKPIVAAIHGAALGGGLEVALACHRRIVTDGRKTILGLPEVQLGLLPGAGGTQRLPRLVGLQRGLDLLLTGKNIYPYPARKAGLVDLVVPEPTLLDAACKAARDLAQNPGSLRQKRKRRWSEFLLEGNPLGRSLILRQARKMVQKRTMGNYPAPPKILDCVATGLRSGIQAGLRCESGSFGMLMRTPQCRELVRLFFTMNAAKKNPLKGRERGVQRLGVLGAGLMGRGIAEVSLQRGLEVLLKDVDSGRIGAAEKTIWQGLDQKVRRRALTPFERDQILGRMHGVLEYGDLRGADMVIEAVFEDLELKRQVLTDTESVTGEETIFASNTSSLPIRQIAAASRRPHQVIGMHYFSPVPKMPLLEIIVTPQTVEWVQATAIDMGIRQGKTVIVVQDGPGFYTTRILAPMMHEALLVLQEGARIEAIDRAMRGFGFPVGPLTLMDEVGIDVGAHVTEVLSPLFATRGQAPENKAAELVQAGFSGRKNRRGFYLYEGKKKRLHREIYRHFGGNRRIDVDPQEIQERLSLVMMNEALWCLQEGILRSPEDGDLGAILGLGFPPFLGGPFRTVDRLGAETVLRQLEARTQTCGPRFRPAPILQDVVRRGGSFYEGRERRVGVRDSS